MLDGFALAVFGANDGYGDGVGEVVGDEARLVLVTHKKLFLRGFVSLKNIAQSFLGESFGSKKKEQAGGNKNG